MIKKCDLYDYGMYIYQDDLAFKFNLASVLLAEFVKFKTGDKIVDFCTGIAPIPLILTTKNKKVNIDAVEIQKNISEIANKNVELNDLNNIIQVLNCDIKDIEKRNHYDIVTCNPPYYKNSKLGNYDTFNISKHEVLINLEEIIKYSKKVLNPKGKLFMIHIPDRLQEILCLLKKYNFGVQEICFIFTNENKTSKLVLLHAEKAKKDNIRVKYKNIHSLKSYKEIFNS